VVPAVSLVHIRLIHATEDETTAEYIVESPDFSKLSEWTQIGRLTLDKIAKRYEFKPADVWSESNALPPEIYGYHENERAALLASKYRGFGWGAWARIIHGYASQFLQSEVYPERHPPAFFHGV
jgi:hypothetical protein